MHERRFVIAIEVVKARKKLVGVSVRRIEGERPMKLALGGAVIAPAVFDSRQFEREALVERRRDLSSGEGGARLLPLPGAGQVHPALEGVAGNGLQKQEQYGDHGMARGTASRVQKPAACQLFSNWARSHLRSLRSAGSLSATT